MFSCRTERLHYAGGIDNGGFARKTHQMNSPSTLRRRNLETQQPPVILDFWLRKTLAGKSHYLRKSHRFRKASFSNVFRPTLKRKAGVFKFLRFEKRFRKAPLF